MNNAVTLRPDFGLQTPQGSVISEVANVQMSIAQAREVARIQGEILMAKKFPRDEAKALKSIESACSRVTLAESAVYEYPRGGTTITGPSIRLAEQLARSWGNIRYGFEVVSQDKDRSTIRVYSYDIEANTQAERTFTVNHIRDTKNGSYALTDQRDIYELVANQASRRLRACILECIPPDIIDYATDLCQKTLESKVKITPDFIEGIINGFEKKGVTKAMIEAYIGRSAESMTISNVTKLRRVYTSLNDGAGTISDFFDTNIKDSENTKVAAPKTTPEKKEKKVSTIAKDAPQEQVQQPKVTPEFFSNQKETINTETATEAEEYPEDYLMDYNDDNLGF